MTKPTGSFLKPFYPALDGLRAIAILSVFAVHNSFLIEKLTFPNWGWVGVDIFFVLSGFLITGILYDSLQTSNYFRNFYIRRTLRIFPLYYAIWLALLCVTPFLHIAWNRYHLASFLYLGNFFVPGAQLHLHASPFMLPYARTLHAEPKFIELRPLWSLCVEEQFYLVWPFVVWFVRSRRALLRICIGIALLAPVLRWFIYLHVPHAATDELLYTSTFFRVDTLLIGAAIALWLRNPDTSARQVRATCWSLALVSPTILALCLIPRWNRWPVNYQNPIIETIGFSLIALTSAGLLLFAIDSTTFLSRALSNRPLTAIGRLSYGIYVLHSAPLQILNGRGLDLARHPALLYLVPFVAFALTYAMAWLSFRFLESPFLRLKDRFAPRPGVSDPPPSPPEAGPTLPTYSPAA